MSYTTFEIQPDGSLLIKLTNEGKRELGDLLEVKSKTDEEIFLELIESALCNGYHIVQPEMIGALTSSLILSDDIIDDETPEDANVNVWWFPMYAIKSYIDDFILTGETIWTKA